MKKILLFCIITLNFELATLNLFSQANRLWATYYGGAGHDNYAINPTVHTDAANNVYIAGETWTQENIPLSMQKNLAFNGFQNSFAGGNTDCYLVKFDEHGNRLWATYYGGSDDDELNPAAPLPIGITTDANNNVYLAGYTASTDFPVTQPEAEKTETMYAGTATDAGGGATVWNNPTNAQDNTPATYATTAVSNNISNYLQATNFGFAIPAAMSVTGIEVHIDWKSTATTTRQNAVYLVVGGAIQTGVPNKSTGAAISTTQTIVTFGDNIDTWGLSLTPGIVNAPDFGVAISVAKTGGIQTQTVSVADIKITVHYAPAWNPPHQIANAGAEPTYGGYDAFLVKFDASGNRLWATYYGGTGNDIALNVTTDIFNNVYMTGYTSSLNGIAAGGFQNTTYNFGPGFGAADAFLVKFDPDGHRIWGTYYGGEQGNDRAFDVATDSKANVYIGGGTNAPTGIAAGGFKNSLGDDIEDAFLVKFDPDGNRLWATYYGGSTAGYGGTSIGTFTYALLEATTTGESIAVDPSDNVYLAGGTSVISGIAFGGFQNIWGGRIMGDHFDGGDVYLVKFDPNGNRIWATYYGGINNDGTDGVGVATDAWGNVYLTGDTYSDTMMAQCGYKNDMGPNPAFPNGYHYENHFLAKFDSLGSRVCATYYGTKEMENGGGVAIDLHGNVYLAGGEFSTSTTPGVTGLAFGGFQMSQGGGVDAYLVKFGLSATAASTDVACLGQCTGIGTVSVTGSCDCTPSYTYFWNPGGYTTPVVTGLCEGTYSVTITDAYGANITTTVTITLTPLLSTNLTTTEVFCNGESTGIATATVSGGTAPYTYQWSNGVLKASVTNLEAGTYTLVVTDNTGCGVATSVTITEPAAILTASVSTSSVCNLGGLANATANGGTSPYYYSWSNGASKFSISNLQAGIYTVTVTDGNNCITITTITISPSSTVTAAISGSVTIALGESTILSASGGGTYSWSPSTALSCINCENPMANPVSTTEYCVMVTDANGCSDNACITIVVDTLCGEVFIPNVFSPNNDGKNDLECIFGNCIVSMEFKIFDRWGIKVFETNNPKQCWDGVYNGKQIKTEVLVYSLQATLINGDSISKTGNISLIR